MCIHNICLKYLNVYDNVNDKYKYNDTYTFKKNMKL